MYVVGAHVPVRMRRYSTFPVIRGLVERAGQVAILHVHGAEGCAIGYSACSACSVGHSRVLGVAGACLLETEKLAVAVAPEAAGPLPTLDMVG